MARIVMKFGGTSMAGIERIRSVAARVKREADAGSEVLVVVSAMALMDGEAAPIDRAEIDIHLLTCRRCASEIETLRSLAETLVPFRRAA